MTLLDLYCHMLTILVPTFALFTGYVPPRTIAVAVREMRRLDQRVRWLFFCLH